MRVNVAEPTTSNAPTAWRTARWKLRSCGNTGRQSERRARKRVSNTVRGSGSTCTKALPRLIRYQIKMSKLQMLQELQRRNYSPSTTRGYLLTVRQFAEYFHVSPEQLGAEEVRGFQLHLL